MWSPTQGPWPASRRRRARSRSAHDPGHGHPHIARCWRNQGIKGARDIHHRCRGGQPPLSPIRPCHSPRPADHRARGWAAIRASRPAPATGAPPRSPRPCAGAASMASRPPKAGAGQTPMKAQTKVSLAVNRAPAQAQPRTQAALAPRAKTAHRVPLRLLRVLQMVPLRAPKPSAHPNVRTRRNRPLRRAAHPRAGATLIASNRQAVKTPSWCRGRQTIRVMSL